VVTKRDTRGLRDWLIQRVSAVLIAAYVFWIVIYCGLHGLYDYLAWQSLFSSVTFKVLTSVVLVSTVWHAWIGLWTVATDYLHSKIIRNLVLLLIVLVLLAYIVFGFTINWH